MNDANKFFSYSYSGAINDELEQIKEKYTPKKTSENMRRLRALDKSVDFVSTMISVLFGLYGSAHIIIGVIWLIKDFYSNTTGAFLTVSGVLITSAVPFFHSKICNLIKAHYAPKIIALIKEIEQNQT